MKPSPASLDEYGNRGSYRQRKIWFRNVQSIHAEILHFSLKEKSRGFKSKPLISQWYSEKIRRDNILIENRVDLDEKGGNDQCG